MRGRRRRPPTTTPANSCPGTCGRRTESSCPLPGVPVAPAHTGGGHPHDHAVRRARPAGRGRRSRGRHRTRRTGLRASGHPATRAEHDAGRPRDRSDHRSDPTAMSSTAIRRSARMSLVAVVVALTGLVGLDLDRADRRTPPSCRSTPSDGQTLTDPLDRVDLTLLRGAATGLDAGLRIEVRDAAGSGRAPRATSRSTARRCRGGRPRRRRTRYFGGTSPPTATRSPAARLHGRAAAAHRPASPTSASRFGPTVFVATLEATRHPGGGRRTFRAPAPPSWLVRGAVSSPAVAGRRRSRRRRADG